MRKLPELPPDVARALVSNARAYYAERDPAKREMIAVLQLRELEDHWPGRVRLNEVKEVFHALRAEAERQPTKKAAG
ncbi:MAG: hypothetical protein WA418_30575 [Bradyrhizobium sp.]